ncbi:MAG TPA: chemotaxis response regulator protein-glutamate methylesterase [Treponemataceae bacterium]|nr:chemotaxis response regulator protein-glutamate methylesterase [Treponemataceae bacterium]
MNKIRVLIVDDSAIVREILTQRLSRDPRIEVVGSAMDPYVARDKLEKLEVDVITLDIEMPRMDGLTFLRLLMQQAPMPVIIVSSLAKEANEAAMKALELGAVDVVPKPGGPFSVEEVIPYLADRIVAASAANVSRLREHLTIASKPLSPSIGSASIKKNAKPASYLANIRTTNQLIAIGASTGGTVALEVLFREWEPDFPPTLVVIHMPEHFTATFAARLNDLSRARVKEAVEGDRLQIGTIYVAPGNFHMLLRAHGTERTIKIVQGPKVCNQRPAVDPLFDSVATHAGRNCIAALLTGMGRDGAQGLLKIREAGGYTIAQDEESSIVWGMPKEAIDLGAAQTVLALDRITRHIRERL